MNVDYSRLSPTDFEDLVANIFETINHQIEPLETFADGADGGIDGRLSTNNKENNVIIQAKHYNDWKNLIANLKKEKEKVLLLKPDSYIIATSFNLSTDRVNTIYELFAPYIKKKSDIWGKKRLNSFLSNNKSILENHMKLWLDSSTILDCIINKGSKHKADILKDDIENKIKVYVKNKSFDNLINILKENSYCIISGIPGIGKTTLAEMASYYFMNNGYKLIKITNDIDEAFNLLNDIESDKQLFYYDDFLGSNFLEQGLNSKNEDIAIIDFIKKISKFKNKKLIFTTREYIINQAFKKYSKFEESGFHDFKYIINLKQYTLDDKVRILYNHLYYSNLDEVIKKDIVENKLYYKLIGKNKKESEYQTFNLRFNPKILSLLLSDNRLKKENFLSGDSFIYRLISILTDHNELYRDVFLEKISESSRNFLFVLFTFNGSSDLNNIKKIWKILQDKKNDQYSEKQWHFTLKELEGTFTTTSKKKSFSNGGYDIHINFIDPFIKDFFISYLNDNLDILEELLELSTSWKQVIYLYEISSFNHKILSFYNRQDILEIIKEKYFQLTDIEKEYKLLWLYKEFPDLKDFIGKEVIILSQKTFDVDLNTLLILLIKFQTLEVINHNDFIADFIDKFQNNYGNNTYAHEIGEFNKYIELTDIKEYFILYGFDFSDLLKSIESELQNYHDSASDVEMNLLDDNGNILSDQSIATTYTKTYLDEDLNNAEILGNFINDNSVYDYLYATVGKIEEAHDNLVAEVQEDEWKDMRENDNLGFDNFDKLFSSLI